MKNWQKKVLAVVLAVALIVTGFATSTLWMATVTK